MNRAFADRGDPAPPSPALYVNYFEMGHNPFEFLIDLGQWRPAPGDEGVIGIHTRVAIAPPYAKMFSELLARSIRDHETEYGPIASVGQAGPFETVLSSLDEFEERARALRSRDPLPSTTSDR